MVDPLHMDRLPGQDERLVRRMAADAGATVAAQVRELPLEPVADDTDGTLGAIVQVGLEVHSRPRAGRVEAARICEAIKAALHRRPEAVPVSGFTVTEIEVQTWVVDRQGDGTTYEGRVALAVHLDA